MDEIAEGTQIAHYRIMEPLGAGGMGAVYKAYDEKLDRVVALKVLSPDVTSNEDRRRRFLQEARAASALNHPHILTVYEIGEADGQPFIAMEHIQGETLRLRLRSNLLPLDEVLDLALQVASGLVKAHENGIIHRDLKPENLMVSDDGYVKILDFGLAKLTEPTRSSPSDSQATMIQVKTQTGMIVGTINYMSPEQLLGRRVDPRSDIFSFGIVLYEMVTGQRPFAGDNDIDTMHAILHQEPEPAHEINPSLPGEIQPILDRALAKKPKHRYRTLKDLSSDLKTLKRELELGRLGKPTAVRKKRKLVLKPLASAKRRRVKIDYQKELNQAQYQAVTTIDGPLLIVAGAGTGKTRTLVYRVARLVQTGVPPESILLLTFTRRAAASMLTRAAELADDRCQRVSGGTFHSMGHLILRTYTDLAQLQRTFTVLDQGDTEDLIDMLRRQMGLNTKDRRFPRKRTIGSIFSMAANKQISIEDALDQHYGQFFHERQALDELHHLFEDYKRERHLLTYDDLLLRWRDLLQENQELCLTLSNQYRYIMVDEYQDTNKLQAQIVRLMAAGHENVAVVGDECQAIYSFRGASFRNMLEFPELFPDAEVIKLEENFRSTQPILDVANAILAEAQESYGKHLYSQLADERLPMLVSTEDENEQSRFVIQQIEELRQEGVPLDEIAVLFRAGSHSFDLEIELGKHGIPYRKYGGIKLAQLAHVKDVLAFLKLIANPSDTISWFRLLKLLEQIGDATVGQILAHLGIGEKTFQTARAKDNLFKKLKQYPAKASYRDQLVRLAHMLRVIAKRSLPVNQLPEIYRFYRPILQAKYDDYPRRERDLEQLATVAERYKSAEELLADVVLDPAEIASNDAEARQQGYVTLSTVHSAKGLEWDTVFVIWVMDGWFPSLRSYDAIENLEEERRLLYVATTRAKRHLYFTHPMSANQWVESGSFSIVSRFLEPLPSRILPRASLEGS